MVFILRRGAGRRRRQRGAAGAILYALCSSTSMYIVHLSAMSILNCPFFDHMEVAETKIDAAASKNAPGVPRGVQDRLWGPSEGPGDAL